MSVRVVEGRVVFFLYLCSEGEGKLKPLQNMITTNNHTIDVLINRLVHRVNEMIKHAVYNYRAEKGKGIRWKDEKYKDLNGAVLSFKKVNEYIVTAVDALSVVVKREGMEIDTDKAKQSLLKDANNAFNTYKQYTQEDLYNKLDVDYLYFSA